MALAVLQEAGKLVSPTKQEELALSKIISETAEKLEKQLNLVIKPKPKLLPKFIYKKLFW